MAHNTFLPPHSISVRKYLVENTPEFLGVFHTNKAATAVVNASDTCALSCPHCLFSAALIKNRVNSPSEITMEQAEHFVRLMNDAELEHLIFSGGGESFENLSVMSYMLENLVHLKQLVTVTSGYFTTTPEETEKVFDILIESIQRGNKKFKRSEVTFLLRLSYDNAHHVPLESIVNAVNYFLNASKDGIKLEVVVRTLLNPDENKDLVLVKRLGGTLSPSKDNHDPTLGMPIIDGFPTRWIQIDRKSIPIIYKPTYFEGLAYKAKSTIISGTSWKEIKAAEEEGESFFNLSLRGVNGEGHNYYQTVLKGYTFWQSELGGVLSYNTPKPQSTKGFSVYLPADGRLFINASSPDSFLPVLQVSSWQQYLQTQASDILQHFVVSRPTDELVALAKEVEPMIEDIINRRNFVFSLAYTSLETPALRLYLTIRLLQIFAQENGIQYANPQVGAFINVPVETLKANYAASGDTLESVDAKDSMLRDPIIGNQQSLYSVKEKNQ